MTSPLFSRFRKWTCAALFLSVSAVGAATAQTAPPDTLYLDDVRAATALNDPAVMQRSLVDVASRLRDRNIRATRLPQLGISGQATLQNEAPELGFGSVSIEGPPLEQYRAQAELQWQVYDGGRSRLQRRAESIRLDEQQMGVELSLQHLMDGASETFFAALLHSSRTEVLEASENALEERLAFIRIRARDGAATEADAAALEAEWLAVGREAEQARVLRRAALDVLGAFTGGYVPDDVILAVPDWSSRMSEALEQEAWVPPVVAELHLREERLKAEAAALQAIRRPQLSVIGQAGMGRPSPFDFLDPELSPFALAGVRLQWSVMDWGQARRNRELMEAQADLAASARESTEQRIQRELADDLALETHLAAGVDTDNRIVTLRQRVVQAAAEQLEAGAQLPAVYTERLAELTAARAARERNRIERSRAQYRVLSMLGALPAPVSTLETTRTGHQP